MKLHDGEVDLDASERLQELVAGQFTWLRPAGQRRAVDRYGQTPSTARRSPAFVALAKRTVEEVVAWPRVEPAMPAGVARSVAVPRSRPRASPPRRDRDRAPDRRAASRCAAAG